MTAKLVTEIALNVNRFVESVCGLQTFPLRRNSSGDADNISGSCTTLLKNAD